ncbi:hypothetical protein HPB51_020012 [Rhipicephalus microplus]|uniref:DDE-1 domain-containing protein n=1 Tax=Rhipicephalus microplus TaxID=6941 RepID=A0A9J6E4B5_RHIMP|nr:hypothetical protein HPB51_020012 [Rhipicephalus microplus]
MLVLDVFCGHLTDAVKRALGIGKANLAVILGGMTSTLEPIDIVLNKSFKDQMRLEYQKWMSRYNPKTPMGRLQRPPFATVCGWVLSTWRSLPDSMVENAFKICSISNSLCGHGRQPTVGGGQRQTLVFRRQWRFV